MTLPSCPNVCVLNMILKFQKSELIRHLEPVTRQDEFTFTYMMVINVKKLKSDLTITIVTDKNE